MYKVFSDIKAHRYDTIMTIIMTIMTIMTHWYDLWNTIVIAINFYNGDLFFDVYIKQSLWNKMS